MTRRRRLLAIAALVLAASVAGCGLGSNEIDEDKLSEDATYEWNTSANATFNVTRSSYAVILNVTNESMEVWQRDALEGEQPVQLRSLKYRYPNGTVIDGSNDNLTATKETDQTTIEMPSARGQVAYTASRMGKTFGTPTVTNGSQEVILPPGARANIPLLSQVRPGNANKSVEDDRMTVRWGNLSKGEKSINVRYYLERDLLLFGGLGGIALLVGIAGFLYYRRQVQDMESRLDELGIDVDYDDDDFDDEGPPPGM